MLCQAYRCKVIEDATPRGERTPLLTALSRSVATALHPLPVTTSSLATPRKHMLRPAACPPLLLSRTSLLQGGLNVFQGSEHCDG